MPSCSSQPALIRPVSVWQRPCSTAGMRLVARLTFVLALVVSGGATAVRAQATLWTGNGNGTSWGNAANWSPATVPNSSSAYAAITATSSNISVDVVSSTFTINRLDLAASSSTSASVTASEGGGLTLINNGGTLPTITIASSESGPSSGLFGGIALNLQAATVIAVTSGFTASIEANITQNADLRIDTAADTFATFAGNTFEPSNATTFTKSGDGTLLVTGNLQHTAATVVSAGVMELGNPSNFFAQSRDLQVNGTLVVSNYSEGGDATQQGTLSGTGSFVKTGGNQLTLVGDNASFSGTIAVNEGTLVASQSNHLGSGTLTIDGGATFRAAGTFATSVGVEIGSDTGRILINSDEALTLLGALSGHGQLTLGASDVMSVSGTLVLGGDNSAYGGNIVLKTGTLAVAADNNLGSSTAAVTFDGGTLHAADTFSTERQMISASSGTVSVESGKSLTLNSNIGGNGSLEKIGGGTLVLTGDNSAVLTRIAGGTVVVSGAENLGGVNPYLMIDGGKLQTTGSIYTNGVTISSSGATLSTNGGTSLEFASLSAFGGSLTKDGAGTLVLYGIGDWFGGGVQIVGGTVVLGNNAGWGVTGASSVGTGTMLLATGGNWIGDKDSVLTVAGTLRLGETNATSLYVVGSLELTSTALLQMKIGGYNSGEDYDFLSAENLVLGGTLAIDFVNGFSAADGDTFVLLDPSGLLSPSSFNSLQLPGLSDGLAWDISLLSSQGSLSVMLAPIPEPAASALLEVSAIGAAVALLRRRRSALTS